MKNNNLRNVIAKTFIYLVIFISGQRKIDNNEPSFRLF